MRQLCHIPSCFHLDHWGEPETAKGRAPATLPFQQTLPACVVLPGVFLCGEGAHEGGSLDPLATLLLHMHSWGCLRRSFFFSVWSFFFSTCWLCCKSNLLKRRHEDQILLSCDKLYFYCLLLRSIQTKDDSIASFIGRINASVSLNLCFWLYPHAGLMWGWKQAHTLPHTVQTACYIHSNMGWLHTATSSLLPLSMGWGGKSR